MNEHKSISERIQAHANHLHLEEKSAATIEKYLRTAGAFACWLDGQEITKERTAARKAYLYLVERGPRQRQRHALRPERPAGLSGTWNLPGKVSQAPAADISG